MNTRLNVLEFLQRQIEGNLPTGALTEYQYPTPISELLGFRITSIETAKATLILHADPQLHGNQQGTVHGGLLSELADAAIGTAHSTALEAGESFTSIDLNIKFFRPVWEATLTAVATPVRLGRSISHYQCEISQGDGKIVALASGTIMTLRGDSALGR